MIGRIPLSILLVVSAGSLAAQETAQTSEQTFDRATDQSAAGMSGSEAGSIDAGLVAELMALPGAEAVLRARRDDLEQRLSMSAARPDWTEQAASALRKSADAQLEKAEIERIECADGACDIAATIAVSPEEIDGAIHAAEMWISTAQPCGYSFNPVVQGESVHIEARTACPN